MLKLLKQVYETALNGDIGKAVDHLQMKENLSEPEQETLVHFLITNKNYEDALNRVGKEDVSILASQVLRIHGIEELKKFQKSYPSSVGDFELAYHSGEL